MSYEDMGITQHIRRQVVWDSAPCHLAESVLLKTGATPASEEVLDHEHIESHRRLNRLLPVDHLIMIFGAMAGESLFHSIVGSGNEFDGEHVKVNKELMQRIGIAASRAVISSLSSGGFEPSREED